MSHHRSSSPFSRTQFFGIRLGQHTLLSLNETSIQFHYVVPSDVCRDNRMPCSTAVAVFDELSTIGFLALDKSHRPGVSVSLSARILADISAGDALTIDIFYDKVRTQNFILYIGSYAVYQYSTLPKFCAIS